MEVRSVVVLCSRVHLFHHHIRPILKLSINAICPIRTSIPPGHQSPQHHRLADFTPSPINYDRIDFQTGKERHHHRRSCRPRTSRSVYMPPSHRWTAPSTSTVGWVFREGRSLVWSSVYWMLQPTKFRRLLSEDTVLIFPMNISILRWR